MNITKPPKFFYEQVSILKSRGMVMPEWSEQFLSHVNYERVKPYWHNFIVEDTKNSDNKKFIDGTNFADVVACYNFDRELRSLLLKAVEIIEISARTKWAYYISFENGQYAHLQETSFDSTPELNRFAEFNARIQKRMDSIHKKRESEMGESYPPIKLESFSVWELVEKMTLGDLSFCYTATRPDILREIYKIYETDRAGINSFLRTLTNIRNRCAHQCRIWNYSFKMTPKFRTKNTKYGDSIYNKKDAKKIYNTILQMIYLLKNIYPDYNFKEALRDLLLAQKQDFAKEMGFIDGWTETEFWRAEY